MSINTKEYSPTKHIGIKIHNDGIKFMFIIKVNGKRYRKTFVSNTAHSKGDKLKSAYSAREAFVAAKEHELNITADADATINDYWTKVKATKGWTDTAISKYDYYYDKHLSHLKSKKIRDIKPTHFTNLNASLNHLSPRSRLKAYEILKPIFELALEDEIILTSPIKKSHIPKRKQLEEKKIIHNAEDKYRKVHEAIITLFGTEEKIKIGDTVLQCHDNPHHRAAFLFGFHGRRLAETLALRWEDVDFDTMTYTIRGEHSKVNTDMVFKLPADVMEALYTFRATSGSVFNVKSLDRHHEKIRKYTGINEFSFHWMRNLCVSALAGMGAEITDLSAMLGHTDSATIRKYLTLQRESSTERVGGLSQKLLGK